MAEQDENEVIEEEANCSGDYSTENILTNINENILNNDDVSRELRDSHRDNKVLPGWSSIRYTDDNSRTIFLEMGTNRIDGFLIVLKARR